MTRRRVAAVALAAGMTMTAAACGSADDEPDASTGADGGHFGRGRTRSRRRLRRERQGIRVGRFGDLLELLGVGQGYALFMTSEPIGRSSNGEQTLVRIENGEQVQWAEPALTDQVLHLSDTGLFA